MTAEITILSDDPGTLPALVSAAARRLAEATSSAEVLGAREMANGAYHAAKTAGRMLKAKGAHDTLIETAHQLLGDALGIESAANIRLADEYDAAQERGEVAGHGRSKLAGDKLTPTVADIGLRHDEIHSSRQLRNAAAAYPGLVQRVVDLAIEQGQEPTRARLYRQVKDITKEIRAGEQAVKRAVRDEHLTALSNFNAPLPQDRTYPIIYADPAWEYDFSPSSGRAVENHYPTMPIEDILALPVEALATEDAILFLWSPPSFIKKGIATLEAWGFELATSLVWVKDRIGTGIYVRQRHEYLLMGKRGKPITPAPGTQPDSVIEAPRRKHSEKPVEGYELIEKMYPGLPKIELFCRSQREGWAAWGNQANE